MYLNLNLHKNKPLTEWHLNLVSINKLDISYPAEKNTTYLELKFQSISGRGFVEELWSVPPVHDLKGHSPRGVAAVYHPPHHSGVPVPSLTVRPRLLVIPYKKSNNIFHIFQLEFYIFITILVVYT